MTMKHLQPGSLAQTGASFVTIRSTSAASAKFTAAQEGQ